MCCYDKVNGVRACGNEYILNGVIRDRWGVKGVTIGTDWGAMPPGDGVDSAAQALNAGVDLEMGSQTFTRHLAQAIAEGKTTEAKVDEAWRRAYTPLFRAGRFDPVGEVRMELRFAPFVSVWWSIVHGHVCVNQMLTD